MFLSGLSVQKRVVHALFLRELKTRFGKYRWGYLWALLEPAIHLGILMLLFGYFMARTMPNISYSVFLVNGLLPWLMVSKTAVRSLNAIEANKGLLNYGPVHPVDTILARALLEGIIYFVVYLIFMFALVLSGETVSVANTAVIITIWGCLLLLAVGLGLILMVVGHAFPNIEKLVPILIRPFYFLSGIIFSITRIPAEFHQYLDWNPLLHAFDLLRHALVPGYTILPSISLEYLVTISVSTLAVGLILYKGREPAIQRST